MKIESINEPQVSIDSEEDDDVVQLHINDGQELERVPEQEKKDERKDMHVVDILHPVDGDFPVSLNPTTSNQRLERNSR